MDQARPKNPKVQKVCLAGCIFIDPGGGGGLSRGHFRVPVWVPINPLPLPLGRHFDHPGSKITPVSQNIWKNSNPPTKKKKKNHRGRHLAHFGQTMHLMHSELLCTVPYARHWVDQWSGGRAGPCALQPMNGPVGHERCGGG
jgi:hypothetical protein